jgi:hypothetical protein
MRAPVEKMKVPGLFLVDSDGGAVKMPLTTLFRRHADG